MASKRNLIFDTHSSIASSESHSDLKLLDDLLHSDVLLSGIGAQAPVTSKSKYAQTIANPGIASELMSSEQKINGFKRKVQYFPDQIEAAHSMLCESLNDYNKSYDLEQKIADCHFADNNIRSTMAGLIGEKVKLFRLREFWLSISDFSSNDKFVDRIDFYLDTVLPNNVFSLFYLLTSSCYFGGLKNNPFCSLVYDQFMIGGISCAWLGNKKLIEYKKKPGAGPRAAPKISYTDPSDKLVMLHLGDREK